MEEDFVLIQIDYPKYLMMDINDDPQQNLEDQIEVEVQQLLSQDDKDDDNIFFDLEHHPTNIMTDTT